MKFIWWRKNPFNWNLYKGARELLQTSLHFPAMLIWQKGIYSKWKKKCGAWREKNFMRQIIENQYLSLSLYPSMPLFFFFSMLYFPFSSSSKKNSSINLSFACGCEKKEEKNFIFLMPCSKVGKICLNICFQIFSHDPGFVDLQIKFNFFRNILKQ